ncbi:CLUMA_CG008642, isoform A [Clunio marinus]|uniref:CLUMA_CG008642, isoform A n=1 Tax=Clunio marinus TaxID=568069 RepID=A0A1J1I569_9DIPT|nr:CLUMA_CG008642, isoform A [Clunio marinus]
MVKRTDGRESPILAESDADGHSDKPRAKYGELVILGYNGFLPQGDRGRRRSKFVLSKRLEHNGVKRSKHYIVQSPETSHAILDTSQHLISYTLSRNQAVIVEFQEDESTDMFQVGRSSESPIDFVVMDTLPGDKKDSKVMQSTISRFACRILVDRSEPRARIFAAGFDSSRNIFLGEKATKWQDNVEMDGVTTNGVLIMHPKGKFCGGNAKCGLWRETSLGGDVFSLRESRSAQQKGQPIKEESNVLQDGTLIDLCGATLLWRSAEGLLNSPTKRDLEKLVDEINAGRPQCPVGLNTLVIPRKAATLSEQVDQPYVYLNCGHTFIGIRSLDCKEDKKRQNYVSLPGHHDWGQDKASGARRCPMCLELGPVVTLCMGIEPAFYVDSGPPTYAFNPCGHMATEKTVKYWANVDIPHGTNGFQAVCPFCATPLNGVPGYVRLIFQDNLD